MLKRKETGFFKLVSFLRRTITGEKQLLSRMQADRFYLEGMETQLRGTIVDGERFAAVRFFQHIAQASGAHRQIPAEGAARIGVLAFIQAQNDVAALVLGRLYGVYDDILGALHREEALAALLARNQNCGDVQLVALAHHGALQQAALPGGECVGEMMGAVVRSHFGRRCGPEQCQVDSVAQHAYAIFAVVEHCGAVALIAKGGVAVVADFEAVFIVSAGTVGRPFDIAELHFVDAFGSGNVHREADFQQAVQFMPLNRGVEFHPDAAAFQRDNLSKSRIADGPLNFHRAAVRAFLHDADACAAAAFHKLLFVVAVDVPSVENTGYILV